MSEDKKRPMLVIRGTARTLDDIRRRAEAEGMTISAYVIDRCLEGELRGRRIRYIDPDALQRVEQLAFALVVAARALRPLAGDLAQGRLPPDLEEVARSNLSGVRHILREIWRRL